MTDLERLYQRLVRTLATTDPARLRQPLRLADIRDTIIPYRAHRRALQLESSEDYELVLMRLCAGEGGFARTEPENIRAEFAAEVGSGNPDLTLVDRHGEAVVSLVPEPLARALAPSDDLAFAPPEARRKPAPAKEPPAPKVSRAKTNLCQGCGSKLPAGRSVKFCPQCGASQTPTNCPRCNTELEPGWKHCVTCGISLNSS
jgi:hypothetical protein